MSRYIDKNSLIEEIQKRAVLFIAEFDNIADSKKDIRLDGVDKTPQEMIAYQLGWLNLLIGWDKDELVGKNVVTPSPNYKWNQLGGLYQSFYEKYKNYSLSELCRIFIETVDEIIEWLNTLDDKTLFESGIRKWTVTNANWPMWKWVHINTVAPFKSFRSQIRKWKKII